VCVCIYIYIYIYIYMYMYMYMYTYICNIGFTSWLLIYYIHVRIIKYPMGRVQMYAYERDVDRY